MSRATVYEVSSGRSAIDGATVRDGDKVWEHYMPTWYPCYPATAEWDWVMELTRVICDVSYRVQASGHEVYHSNAVDKGKAAIPVLTEALDAIERAVVSQ